jgi:DNA-directed RNA polymerase subunit RPC12/RpoP
MKMKKLKTLEEHNKKHFPLYTFDLSKPLKNGIACPKCGDELIDSTPMSILASNPPKKDIKCESCDYSGYRIA